MRRQHLAFALMWIIANPASAWAKSASASDTVLRAAYCLGVLSEAISSVKRVPGDVASSETAKAADFFDEVSKPLEQKRQRYYQYLAVQVIFGEMQTSIFAIGERGKADVRQKTQGSAAASSVVTRCRTSCGDAAYASLSDRSLSECALQCVAKQDQVHANILKCTTQPDQLPF
jgi:hypothetical protein